MAQKSYLNDSLLPLIALASPAHGLSTPYAVTPARAYAGTTRLPRHPSSTPCAVQSRDAHSGQGCEWTPRCAGVAHQLPSVGDMCLGPTPTAPWCILFSLYSYGSRAFVNDYKWAAFLARNNCCISAGRKLGQAQSSNEPASLEFVWERD